jgi:hypothetical protein
MPRTREDALVFHCLAISSFLESATPEYVRNLKHVFAADAPFAGWLEETWQREEVEHGRLVRDVLRSEWPAFDWSAAYAEFTARYAPRCEASLLRPTPALEALARCVTETEAAAGYRALAAYSQDVALRALLHRMAADEARHYAAFRQAFLRHNQAREHGILERLRLVIARNRLVRDEDLAIAFDSIGAHWRGARPFAALDYRGFLGAVGGAMLQRHFPLRAAARMFVKPITEGGWLAPLLLAGLPRLLRREFA